MGSNSEVFVGSPREPIGPTKTWVPRALAMCGASACFFEDYASTPAASSHAPRQADDDPRFSTRLIRNTRQISSAGCLEARGHAQLQTERSSPLRREKHIDDVLMQSAVRRNHAAS